MASEAEVLEAMGQGMTEDTAVADYQRALRERIEALPWEVHGDDEKQVLRASVLALLDPATTPVTPEGGEL